MRKHAVAAKHTVAADRIEANGPNVVEKPLSQREIIDIRWRWPSILNADVARIVQLITEPRMRLQPVPVWQIDGMRRDVINRGAAVGIGQRHRLVVSLLRRNALLGSGRLELPPG